MVFKLACYRIYVGVIWSVQTERRHTDEYSKTVQLDFRFAADLEGIKKIILAFTRRGREGADKVLHQRVNIGSVCSRRLTDAREKATNFDLL